MQTALGTINNTDRTLGFRYKEMHLPLDAEIYVLGVAGKNRCIGAPPAGAKGQRFLISIKSRGAHGGARHQEQMDAGAWRLLSDWCRRLSRLGLLVGAAGFKSGCSAARCPAR